MSFADLINKHKSYSPFKDGNEEFSFYAQIDFEELLRTSPSKITGTIGDRIVEGLLADVKYGAELEDDKYLLVRYNEVLESGNYFLWRDDTFIITSKERLADEGHASYRLKRCNSSISFTNRKGKMVTIKAHVYNKLFYTEGIDKYTDIVMPDGLCQIVVQHNEDTACITRNIRLLIGEQAFMVTYVDKSTEPGIIQVTLSEVLVDQNDNTNNGVAQSPYETGIEGKSSIFLGMTSKYKLGEDIVECTVTGDCATIDSFNKREIIVKANKEGKFFLIALCEDNTYKKEITVRYQNFD